MYRTTSVLALGLFIGLAPIGALAQTQSDDTDTLQTTQPADTQQSTDVKVDIPRDDDAETATDTDTEATTDDDAEVATDTDTEATDDDAEVATDTDTEAADDDAEVATDTDTEAADDDAEMATDTDTEATTDDDAEIATDDDTATDDEADVATTEAGDVADVIPEQDASEMLGSSLMGASVNLADEEIGTVSDVIIADDYTVRGIVVGVGGFLGIGEKRVALPVERLTIQMTEPGEVELSTDMTREELEQKEAFKTAVQVQSEQESGQAQQEAEAQQPVAPAVPAPAE